MTEKLSYNIRKKGFTLIELLVVIAIIGVLASVVFASLNQTRQKARIAAATAEVNQIVKAIELLRDDTGLGPNGCHLTLIEGPECGGENGPLIHQGDHHDCPSLNSPRAGLTLLPVNGAGAPLGPPPADGTCIWTAAEVSRWRGPYIAHVPLDPWGHGYVFDPDYYARSSSGCHFNGVAVFSAGPDGDDATCDDIVVPLYVQP